jgi:hypothetical protein
MYRLPSTAHSCRRQPGWAAFKALPDGTVLVMGDTVVFEDEITPAMDAAFAHGLEITALHNHFAFDRPPAYFMHIRGQAGTSTSLARILNDES